MREHGKKGEGKQGAQKNVCYSKHVRGTGTDWLVLKWSEMGCGWAILITLLIITSNYY